MKKIYIIGLMSLLLITSCEKFFNRQPEDEFAAQMFFASQADLQYYTNGLINTALPSETAMALGSDVYTDFCGTRESESFFWPNRYTAATASGWTYSNWSFLRKVAYMLDNMHNAKGKVSDKVYNHYEGVARFFRAYSTFGKVKKFGDVYWIDKVVSPSDSTILYGPRQDREYIMHKIVEDLAFASEHCLTSGSGIKSDGCIYINKYTALAMASRVCLYEASYRKYHSVNPSTGKVWNNEYETSEELFQMAFDFSKELVESGAYKLNSNFRSLFDSPSLKSDEVLWGRTFSEELGVKHSVTYKYVVTTSSKLYGPTKDYIMMFLKSDGKPFLNPEVSWTQEFANRDKRLAATVLAPGQKRKDANNASVDYLPDFAVTVTGYNWMKWVQPEYNAMSTSNNTSTNSIPVLRYAEVLLNYAEAAEELGLMTQSLWNETIGELRKVHGGISANTYPLGGSYTPDPYLRNYYQDVMHPVTLSDVMLEIRRERAVELMLEGSCRYDDLMRWNMGDLIERRHNHQGWKGIYFSQEEAAKGFKVGANTYTVSTVNNSSSRNYKITTQSDGAFTLSKGTYGYLIYNYELEWDDKMYLYPIPTVASNVNPNLGQNDGWQWL